MDFLTEPVPHDEAVHFIADKPAVLRAVFDEMVPEIQARAFTVGRLTQVSAIQRIRDEIALLPAGGDWNDIKHAVADELEADWGDNAERQAELLLRLHGFQAYAAANHFALEAEIDTLPYCQYVTVEDNRVRLTHWALHGIILRQDSPFWIRHTPPWEWGCRCDKIGLPESEVAAIRAGEAEDPPEQQLVLQGPLLRKLESDNTLVRKPPTEADLMRLPRAERLKRDHTGIYDLRTPSERGQAAGFEWEPGSLRLNREQIKARYDLATWQPFEAMAARTQLPDRPETILEWMDGTGANGLPIAGDERERVFPRKSFVTPQEAETAVQKLRAVGTREQLGAKATIVDAPPAMAAAITRALATVSEVLPPQLVERLPKIDIEVFAAADRPDTVGSYRRGKMRISSAVFPRQGEAPDELLRTVAHEVAHWFEGYLPAGRRSRLRRHFRKAIKGRNPDFIRKGVPYYHLWAPPLAGRADGSELLAWHFEMLFATGDALSDVLSMQRSREVMDILSDSLYSDR